MVTASALRWIGKPGLLGYVFLAVFAFVIVVVDVLGMYLDCW